jgi:DNA (cytosine-5)-methyltransferase 1
VKADNDNTLHFLSVCAGIEAASLAWHNLGWRACLLSEIEKFPRRVLAHHYPTTRLWGDFTALRVRHLRRMGLPLPSILVGGTPCQAFSVAGLRKSLADARGNLTLSFVRLAHALADAGSLRNAVWENVPGVLNTKDNAFGCFLGAIVGADDALPCPKGGSWPNAGMVAGPRARAAWRVLDAQYFGLAQRRRRVFVVVDFGNGADPAAVLFEPVGVHGNPAPRRETQKDVAGTVAGGARKGGGYSTDDVPLTSVLPERVCADDIGALTSVGGHAVPGNSVQDAMAGQLIAYGGNNTSGPIDVAACLNAKSTQRGDFESETFLVQEPIAFSAKDYGGDAMTELAPTLRAGGHSAGHANAGVMPAVAFNTRQDPIHEADCAQPLGAKDNGNGVLISSAVRRLTPRECERLQGFPDDYTLLPGYDADGPRYKALGNSMAVPVMRWIGERIALHMPAANDNAPAKEAA